MTIIMLANIDNPYADIPYNVDFETLKRVQDMVSEIVGLILGIAAGYIIIGMFLITVLDVCYMMIPPLQDIVRGKNWDGSVDNGSRLRVVSKDATSSVRESYVSGANCLSIYIRKRIKTYIMSAIILYVIIAGSQVIIDIVIYLISGLLKVANIV